MKLGSGRQDVLTCICLRSNFP